MFEDKREKVCEKYTLRKNIDLSLFHELKHGKFLIENKIKYKTYNIRHEISIIK